MKAPVADDSFWAKVDRAGDGCWEWQGSTAKSGYGQWRGKPAHWVALSSAVPTPDLGRPLDADDAHYPYMLALHHCDNPPCCNPAHLYWGTAADNTRDKMARHIKCGFTNRTNGTKCKNVGVHDVGDIMACGIHMWAIRRFQRLVEATYWKKERADA